MLYAYITPQKMKKLSKKGETKSFLKKEAEDAEHLPLSI